VQKLYPLLVKQKLMKQRKKIHTLKCFGEPQLQLVSVSEEDMPLHGIVTRKVTLELPKITRQTLDSYVLKIIQIQVIDATMIERR